MIGTDDQHRVDTGRVSERSAKRNPSIWGPGHDMTKKKKLKVHAVRDDHKALCGRRIGSELYTGGIGQVVSLGATTSHMRQLGVDCAQCLRKAQS